MTDFLPRMWAVEIRPPDELITTNDRPRHYHQQARLVRVWRTAAFAAAGRHRLPKGLARVRIDITVWPVSDRLDNDDAVGPTCKAIIDGLGPPFVRRPSPTKRYKTPYRGANALGYGLIPNDNRRHLDGYHPHLLGAEPPRGRVLVHIVDLAGVPAGRTWTPDLPTAAGGIRLTAKRPCNGCGRRLGDATEAELEVAISREPLPDVTGECPSCAAGAGAGTPATRRKDNRHG